MSQNYRKVCNKKTKRVLKKHKTFKTPSKLKAKPTNVGEVEGFESRRYESISKQIEVYGYSIEY